jgi:alginate O-acetyltransferase complex protein AlgI
MPYLAVNVADFWRRWHISLSSWLRDYLFIPLGGSHGGRRRTYRNLLITMTLGGLWHGASWTFVIWGALHGLFLIVHRLFRGFCESRPRLRWLLESTAGTAARVALTFLCVSVGWVFFRAQSFEAAAVLLSRLAGAPGGQSEPLAAYGLALTLLVVVACHALARGRRWQRLADRLPAPVLGAVYAAVLTLTWLLAPGSAQPFIYFQF